MDLNQYLPQPIVEGEPDTQSFSIVTKNKAIGNLEYMGLVDSHTGNLEQTKLKYEALNAANNGDQNYYIINNNLSYQFMGALKGREVSHDDIANIINQTHSIIGIPAERLLTQKEMFEKKQQEELEKAMQLGLVKTEEEILENYIPKKLEEDKNDLRSFAIISKHKAIGNLQLMEEVDPMAGSLAQAKKLCDILNQQGNGDKEFFIVKFGFPSQLPTLDEDTILRAVNLTQEIIGSDRRLKDKPVMAVVPPEPVTPIETIAPIPAVTPLVPPAPGLPSIEDILSPPRALPSESATTPAAVNPAVPPTPVALKENYGKIAEQLSFFKNQQKLAKTKKSTIGAGSVVTMISLLGIGALSMTLAPVAYPAAIAVGVITVLKLKFFKGDPVEEAKWAQREDLLKQSAAFCLGITDPKEIKKVKNTSNIKEVAFTPEILLKFEELSKKAKLPVFLSPTIPNIGEMRNKFNTAETTGTTGNRPKTRTKVT